MIDNPSRIVAVIFDIDGTLVDSVDLHARAWQETLALFGHDVPFADIRAQIGKGGDQLLPMFLSEAEIAARGDDIETERGRRFKSAYLAGVRPFPETRPLFQRLRASGRKIAVASSAKEDELSHYLTLAKVEDLVDAATSSADAERSKPHPDIFAVALERLGNPPPEAVIMVGDSPYDAEAAAKLGCRTIGVLCGGFPEQVLRDAGCVAIFQDPADLLAKLETSPLR